MATTFVNAVPSMDAIAYAVKPGDTLSSIIHHYYGRISHSQGQEIIRAIQANNPTIKNPNYIRPGQLIMLEVPVQHCRTPPSYGPLLHGYGQGHHQEDWFTPMERNWASASPDERSLQVGLAKFMLSTGSAQLVTIDRTFKGSSPLLVDMVENYESFKRGDITKGQYDYRRRKTLQQFTSRLGPTNLLLNGSQSPNEVLRISRINGVAPTQPLTQQISKMQRVSKVAARGGVVLSVAGLGLACYEISKADDVERKNDILVESVGSVVGGIAYGVGVGLTVALMTTPVGWVGALVFAIGGAAVSYGVGQAAGELYDASGRKIDFASQTGVSTLCSRGGVDELKDSSPKISNAALSVL